MKKFELTVTLTDDGVLTMEGDNKGFNAMEILGFLEGKQMDIYAQINHPERFHHTRTVAMENGEQDIIEDVEPYEPDTNDPSQFPACGDDILDYR